MEGPKGSKIGPGSIRDVVEKKAVFSTIFV